MDLHIYYYDNLDFGEEINVIDGKHQLKDWKLISYCCVYHRIIGLEGILAV